LIVYFHSLIVTFASLAFSPVIEVSSKIIMKSSTY
jgi:hypothetical protein